MGYGDFHNRIIKNSDERKEDDHRHCHRSEYTEEVILGREREERNDCPSSPAPNSDESADPADYPVGDYTKTTITTRTHLTP